MNLRVRDDGARATEVVSGQRLPSPSQREGGRFSVKGNRLEARTVLDRAAFSHRQKPAGSHRRALSGMR
jgi:hypothetical protein